MSLSFGRYIRQILVKIAQVSPCFDGPLVLVGRDAVDWRDGGAGGCAHGPRGQDRPLRGGGRRGLDGRLIRLGHGPGRPLGGSSVGVGVLVCSCRNLQYSTGVKNWLLQYRCTESVIKVHYRCT